MKRFFSLSFIALALLISAAGVAPAVHAEGIGTTGFGTDDADIEIGAGPTAAETQAAITAINQASDKPAPDDVKTSDAYNSVMQWILKLFAWLLGVSAIVLNYAVYYTVVIMGAYVKDLAAIGVTWTILRDIGNIFLIFGFLAVGVTTILNVDWYGKGTKMLPMMFIAAVFLNFSLFFTEAIIDTGNLFATQFYKQINNGVLAPPTMSLASVTEEGISNKVMNKLGLQTLYNAGDPKILEKGNPWLVGFMGILLFIVTAFVFFALAFILVARFVILIFLIILAPVGFAGLAVPMMAKRAGQWWDKLFEQTITAPILMLMLYVALAVITDDRFLTGFNPPGAIAPGASTGFIESANLVGFGGFILSFIVAMGLLIAVVIQSKNLSAFGASWASKTAGALTFGLTAAGMRASGGWLSRRAAQGWRKTTWSRAPILGRAVAGVFDRGAKASFDVRGAKVGGYGLAGGKVDAGDAQKGGFRGWEKEKIKEREDYAKDLEQTTGKFWGLRYATGEVEQQKIAEADRQKAEQGLEDIKFQNSLRTQSLDRKQKAELGEFNDDVDKAQKDLAKMQDDQRKGANISQQEMDAAQAALTTARTARDQKVAEQRVDQEALKETNGQLLKVQQDEVKVRREAVDKLKRAGQEGYAKGLRLGLDKDNFINKVFNPQRNTKAADNIIKDAAKSKKEKDFDALKKLLEDAAKKEEKPGEKKSEEKKPEPPKTEST